VFGEGARVEALQEGPGNRESENSEARVIMGELKTQALRVGDSMRPLKRKGRSYSEMEESRVEVVKKDSRRGARF
jgi:hypothetical protein